MSKKSLKIELLGNVRFTVDDKPVTDLPTRKAEALLIYLVSHRRAFAREVLADLLWDDRPQDQALANLRSILSSLRRSFDPYLTITRQSIAFNHESNYWLDVTEFERNAALTADEVLRAAVDLFQGEFLEGFYLRDSIGFEEWALLERERLQRTAVSLLWRVINAESAAGDYAAGLGHVNKLLRFDNLSERAHRQKMLLLARLGQHNAALQHYEICCAILDEELGVAPAPETTDLYEQIRLARELPASKLPAASPHFVGRSGEVADLRAQLRNPACRLITLLGAGGMGKTRLVIETARRILEEEPGQFLHGICFVPLAAIEDARLFAPILADTLGAPSPQHEEPTQAVLDFLRNREVLVILDNFEQLTGEADWLAQILAEAPQVKLLITSQEPLRLQEEWLVDLAGLAAPDEDIKSESAASAYSAIQLFLQIARRLHPQYRPSLPEMQAISQICRLLQGMPLGIELSAVWIRQFSPPQIAEEIGRGLDFLSTNLRNVPERHRSLRAAFDYAWHLLPPEIQTIFAQLATFHSGFSEEAAAVIAGAQARHLALLAEKSLLRLENSRYDMHPMLSRFAAEKLTMTANAPDVYARHARFYLDFLAGQANGETTEQRQAIQIEMANVRAAWQWAAAQQQYQMILDAASILHNFFSAQSWFRQGIDAFHDASAQLSTATADSPEAAAIALLAQTRCELLGRSARMQIHIGQLDAANRALDEALREARYIEDPRRLSTILGYTAITAFYAGDLDRAIALAEESLTLDESSGDLDGVAFALNFLGSCHKSRGDYAAASQYFTRSIAIYEEMKDDLGRAMSLNNLGNLAQVQGEFNAAHDHYLLCSRLFREQNHVHGAATTLANAGRLSRKMGNLVEAETLLQESLSLKREMQDERGVAVSLVGLADVAVAAGDGNRARVYLSEALILAHNAGDVKLTLEGLAVWGVLRQQESADPMPGARLLAFVLAHPALAQEVRDQVQKAYSAITPKIWENATAWAAEQTLTALVHSAVAEI